MAKSVATCQFGKALSGEWLKSVAARNFELSTSDFQPSAAFELFDHVMKF